MRTSNLHHNLNLIKKNALNSVQIWYTRTFSKMRENNRFLHDIWRTNHTSSLFRLLFRPAVNDNREPPLPVFDILICFSNYNIVKVFKKNVSRIGNYKRGPYSGPVHQGAAKKYIPFTI